MLNSAAHGQGLLSHWVPCSHIADFTSMAEPLMKVKVKVAQSCLTLYDPMDYTVPGILQARIREWAAFPSSRGSSQPRDRTQVSHIAGGSLPAEPQGEPQNTGVGSLSLLQQIFLTQESNRDLLYGFLCYPGGSVVKSTPTNEGDVDSNPDSGRSHMLWSS